MGICRYYLCKISNSKLKRSELETRTNKMLQHRRGYVPFITQVNTRCKLTGNYK